MLKKTILATIILLLPVIANAADGNHTARLKLLSYEPNKMGWTFDENDVGFLDFTVSLKYPFAPEEALIALKKKAGQVFFRDAAEGPLDRVFAADPLSGFYRPVWSIY